MVQAWEQPGEFAACVACVKANAVRPLLSAVLSTAPPKCRLARAWRTLSIPLSKANSGACRRRCRCIGPQPFADGEFDTGFMDPGVESFVFALDEGVAVRSAYSMCT